jgi:hypothetical protein
MCSDCTAPAPVDHACRNCAKTLGLEGALPIDFGFLSTYLLAARSFFASLGRLVAWNVVAFLVSFTVCAIPGVIGVMVLAASGYAWGDDLDTAGRQLGAFLALGSVVMGVVLKEFILLPAGCAIFVDQAIRSRDLGFGEAFALAFRRVIRSAGTLFLVFLVYALLAMLLLLPASLLLVYGSQVLGNPDQTLLPLAGFTLILCGGLLLLVVGLGLAVPAVVLEQRSAFEALGRAWELSQQHLWSWAGMVIVYALLYAICSVAFQALGQVTIPLVSLVLSMLPDLFWPALLVAAYHGLVAEHAGTLGRG